MLDCIARDIARIPKTDPSRAENAILDLQIEDMIEVQEKYLSGEPPTSILLVFRVPKSLRVGGQPLESVTYA